MGLASVNLMQLAPKTVILCEIARNDGYWAVQTHSRSPILIPIERPFVTFYYWIMLTCPVSHRFRVTATHWSKKIVFHRVCHYLTLSFSPSA